MTKKNERHWIIFDESKKERRNTVKNLYLNFSTKIHGSTGKFIEEENKDDSLTMFLPMFLECYGCAQCKGNEQNNCILPDSNKLNIIIDKMLEAKNIHFFTPVYLNMPTAKLMAFLGRLSSISENAYNRGMFYGKNAYIYTIADVSGTQACSNSLLGALNMLGFTIPGRAVKSRVRNWKDYKIRGGKLGEEKFMPAESFKTLSESKE